MSSPPKALLDACVLFPSVLRAVLLAVARAGLFVPQWSPRILEEWARAAARQGPLAEAEARGAAAVMAAHWPRASHLPNPAVEARLWLPDPNDLHVLAAAIASSADRLITFNLRDFPRGAVQAEGLRAEGPDGFLYDLWLAHPDAVARAAAEVQAEASRRADAPVALRPLLKRAGLPRLAKALA